MSKKKVVKGNCYICNEYGKLTFEHIPPKSVFNDKLVKVYQGDSYAKLISVNVNLFCRFLVKIFVGFW